MLLLHTSGEYEDKRWKQIKNPKCIHEVAVAATAAADTVVSGAAAATAVVAAVAVAVAVAVAALAARTPAAAVLLALPHSQRHRPQRVVAAAVANTDAPP